MPYTPGVAHIYPNIDTVLSNYVINDAINDSGVLILCAGIIYGTGYFGGYRIYTGFRIPDRGYL